MMNADHTRIACLTLLATALPAQDSTPGGDSRYVEFTLPFEDALASARRENRLMFLKPIYGGVDTAGAKDYRCGSW